MLKAIVHAVRATTNKPWYKNSIAPVHSLYDLSDHHPSEWEIDGLLGVTYNIQFLPRQVAPTKGKQNSEDIKAAAVLIAQWLARKSANYDVICIQELFDAIASEAIEKELAKLGYAATKRLGGHHLGTTIESATSGGARIFVRKELGLEDTKGHIFKHKVDYFRGADALVDKGVKHAVVTKDGQKYHILNTHSQASYDDKSRENFVEVALAQLIELKEYVETQKRLGVIKATDRIALCGDFNIPKDPLGDNLDAVSQRGDLLFKRAQILLGPSFHLVQPGEAKPDEPIRSFDPSTNSYLADSKERVTANLDLVMSVDAQQSASHHPYLDALVHSTQLALACSVEKNTGLMDSQMSKGSVEVISSASRELDAIIQILKETKDSLENIPLKALREFIKTEPIKKRIEVKTALVCALAERYSTPEQCARIKECIDDYALKSGNSKQVENLLQSLITSLTIQLTSNSEQENKPLNIKEQIEPWINKIQKKFEIDTALNDILDKAKGISPKKIFFKQTVETTKTLYHQLKSASDEYFKIDGTNEAEYTKACEVAINTAAPILKQHSGVWAAVGNFTVLVGTLLNSTGLMQMGYKILRSKTDSIRDIEKFKRKLDELSPLDNKTNTPGSTF